MRNIRLTVLALITISFFFSGCSSNMKKEISQKTAEETIREEKPGDTPEKEAAENTEAAVEVVPEGPENGELKEEELKKIEEELNDSKYNGFVVAEFASPEDIYWEEVFYNGAGIDTSGIDEKTVEEAFMKKSGWEELYTGLTYIPEEAMLEFVKKTTGTDYEKMKHPLDWEKLEDLGVYAFCHGDTNFMPVHLLSGMRKDGTLTIDYVFETFGGEEEAEPYRIILKESPEGYVFVSNQWNPSGGKDAAIKEIYHEIISKYATAVKEGWDMEKLEENNLSYLCGLYANTRGEDSDPTEMMGYYLHDIDDDGVDELFIGADSGEDFIETIFDAYSVKGGQWTRIFSGGERDEYYLASDGTFYNAGSASAGNYILVHYRAAGPYKFLTPIDGVIYDMDFEDRTKDPWYYSKDNFWNTEEAESVTEEFYDDYVNKAETSYVRIDYTPFSSVE